MSQGHRVNDNDDDAAAADDDDDVMVMMIRIIITRALGERRYPRRRIWSIFGVRIRSPNPDDFQNLMESSSSKNTPVIIFS